MADNCGWGNPIQVEDSLSEILLGVCSSAEYYVINFARIFLETTFD